MQQDRSLSHTDIDAICAYIHECFVPHIPEKEQSTVPTSHKPIQSKIKKLKPKFIKVKQ